MSIFTKLIPLVLAFIPATGWAEEWIYGDCLPMSVETFYECHELDGKIVYTNEMPSLENLAEFGRQRSDLVEKAKEIRRQQIEIQRRLNRLAKPKKHRR